PPMSPRQIAPFIYYGAQWCTHLIFEPTNLAWPPGYWPTWTPISSHTYQTSLATGLNPALKYRTWSQISTIFGA
ncbi:hypothetical protein FA13DRAFT_1727084, partial [Coprinellus micaceus]